MTYKTISRREALIGIAAACTSAAEVSNAATGENPVLLTLSDALPGILNAYTQARSDVDWIVAEWQCQMPVPDQAINYFGAHSKTYTTLDGRIPREDHLTHAAETRSIGTVKSFEYARGEAEISLKIAKLKGQPRKTKQYQRNYEYYAAKVEPARAYWAEVERIESASGIGPAKNRLHEARDNFKNHVKETMLAEAHTMTGVLIQAQALAAWDSVEAWAKLINEHNEKWMCALANSIIKQASTQHL